MTKPLPWRLLLSLILWCARAQQSNAQFIDYTYESGISIASDIAMWGCGMSAFDFNRDGFDDLTIAENGAGIALYQSVGNGSFNQVSYIPLAATIKQVMWVDFDNDFDADLFVTTNGSGFFLFERTDDNSLVQRTDLFSQYAQFDGQGASWGDYDKDGWKDLFVCSYLYGQAPQFPNLLFHNDQGMFTQVGQQLGVASWANQAFQSVWTDFDQDGWKDLYVINDHGVGNEYYRNDAGMGFENLSTANGSGVYLASMSNSVADFDRDGDFDVFISNGGEQALLENTNGMFEDVAAEMELNEFTFGWAGVWLDHNNDGWQDLYLCNTNGYSNGDNNFFWENQEGEVFDEVEFESYELSSFVAVTGDFNNDRFADLAVYNGYPSSVHVWINEGQSNHHSVKLNLQGEVSDYFGVGAEVRAYVGGNVSLQQVLAGENYLAQNASSILIGCGEAMLIDSLIVTWPSGWNDVFFNLPVDTNYLFTEGQTFQLSVHSESGFGTCEGSACTVNLSMNDLNFQGSIVWSNGQEGYQAQWYDAGSFSVTVTNQFGLQRTVTFNIHQYTSPEIETIIRAPVCNAQSNGTCTIISADVVTINEIEFQNSFTIDNLASGEYLYAIVDVNGCASSLPFVIPETPPMNLLQADYFVCEHAIELPPLEIDGAAIPFVVSVEAASSLEEGEQFVVITDHNDCTAGFSIFIDHFAAAEVEVQADTACAGASASWSYEVLGDVQVAWAEVQNASQEELVAGDYVLQTIDQYGCVAQHDFTVHAYDSIRIEFSIDEETNLLHAHVTGGVAPYAWQWSSGETAADILMGHEGEFELQVTDAAGCTAQADTVVVLSHIDESFYTWNFYASTLSRMFCFESPKTGYLTVHDMQGRIVWAGRVQKGRQRLDALSWPVGTYVARLVGSE